jgi:hypothetical protein
MVREVENGGHGKHGVIAMGTADEAYFTRFWRNAGFRFFPSNKTMAIAPYPPPEIQAVKRAEKNTGEKRDSLFRSSFPHVSQDHLSAWPSLEPSR